MSFGEAPPPTPLTVGRRPVSASAGADRLDAAGLSSSKAGVRGAPTRRWAASSRIPKALGMSAA
jgi:hypothetical protein